MPPANAPLINPILRTYDRHAWSYDRTADMMNRMINRERHIFSHLHGRILEIGTGTGANLSHYARDSEVIATDWSENMVRVAKSKVKGLHLTQVKEIVVADAQRLSHRFPAQSFDFITATCVFCSIPEPLQIGRASCRERV